MQLDYPIYDADNHYYEPDDCFSRHIEAKYRDRTYWIDRDPGGHPGRMYLGDQRCRFFSVGVGENIGPPGIMKDFLRGLTEEGGSPALNPINGLEVPEYTDRKARLALMDRQGVEGCLMLPTAGVGVEPELREPEHREILYPTLRAFNRWLEEDWGYGRDGRIFGTPIVSLAELDRGLAELDRVIAAGARFVMVTTGPVDGRSPGDPCFDPFWARVQEAGVHVVYHIGHTPFGAMYSAPWGYRANPPSHRHSFMEYHLAFTERPIVDTLAALIADNVFGRFPDVQVLSVEYGAAWVPHTLHKLDHIARLYSQDLWRFGAPPAAPSEIFRRNIRIVPFFEDDVVGLARLVGADCLLNGSDFPHPEGLAEPAEFADELEGLPEADIRRIMRDNFATLIT